MCSSVERILIKERDKGISGMTETLEELGYSDEFIIEKIMEKFEMTREEALKFLK